MPFRTIDPDEADQLATLQARREASRQRVLAGERLRAAADQARLQPAPAPRVDTAEDRANRAGFRLASAVAFEGWRVLGGLLALGTGLVAGFGALLDGFAVEGWGRFAVGVLGFAWTVALLAYLRRTPRRHLEAFRRELRALPFPVTGVEDALGYDGELSTITAVITPLHDLPAATVASLVALIAPDVRIGAGAGDIMVERRGTGVQIVRRFKLSLCSSGDRTEDDSSARGRWVRALVRTTLPPLHDLHAIASVELEAKGE